LNDWSILQDLPNPDSVPESIESEQAVLGAILFDPKSGLDEALERLNGYEFHSGSHRKIFQSMRELHDQGIPVDLTTLVGRLQEKGWLEEVGSIAYLTMLNRLMPTAANIGFYIAKVIEKHVHRELINSLEEQKNIAIEASSPTEVLSQLREKMEQLLEMGKPKRWGKTLREILPDVFEEAESRYTLQRDGTISGIPSGFTDLDRLTAGFQQSDLIIVGARPSVGKTAFALNIGRNAAAAKQSRTVAIFSLEMSEKQLVGRMVCAEGNIDAGRFRTGYFEGDDWERMTMAIGALSDLPIVIDDTPAITVSEIRSKCRRIKQDRGLSMIVIDYLQLVVGRGKPGESRQDEVSHISRTLKQLARELEVPVIALSQLSRGVEQRQDKRPMLSDLRESGSLEQDADIVAFLYRDDYYDKETEKKNIIEIIIAKQRNGPVGTVELVFLKQFNKFVNLDRAHSASQSPQAQQARADSRRSYRVPDMNRGR